MELRKRSDLYQGRPFFLLTFMLEECQIAKP
jgi:hypothetical protein